MRFASTSRLSMLPAAMRRAATAVVRAPGAIDASPEDVRDRVRALADTEAFQQSHRERKKLEMRFAHMKRISGSIGFDYEA